MTDHKELRADAERAIYNRSPIMNVDPKAVTALLDELADLKTEYRKVELLWKESAVAQNDYKQRYEAADALWMGALKDRDIATTALEKAERDQLRGQIPRVSFDDDALGIQWREAGILLGIYIDGTAWISFKEPGGQYGTGETPVTAESLQAIVEKVKALATPLPAAATVVQESYFVDPRVVLTLTPEEIAVERDKFYEAAKNAKPMDIKALDAQLRTADSVQVRTPDGIQIVRPGDIACLRNQPKAFSIRNERWIATLDAMEIRTSGTVEVCEFCRTPGPEFLGCQAHIPSFAANCPIRPKQGA